MGAGLGRGGGLAQQDAHEFAGGKGDRQQGGELAAVGGHFFDVHFVDGVVDLSACPDDPNLGSVAIGICQQFVELCRHEYGLISRVVKGLEAMASPNHSHEQGVRSIKMSPAQPCDGLTDLG